MKINSFAFLITCMFLFTSCDEETPIEKIETEQEELENEQPKEVTFLPISPTNI